MPNPTVPAAALGLPEDKPAGETSETSLLAARRELWRIAEAAIELLDAIDAPGEDLEDVGDDEPSLGWHAADGEELGVTLAGPTDDREVDLDFETTGEDDEAGGDHEPNLGWTVDGRVAGPDEENEPSLGWTLDGDASGIDADDELTAPETSAGLPRVTIAPAARAGVKALFDARLGLWLELGFSPSGNPVFRVNTSPRFPHDAPGRRPFDDTLDVAALERALGVIVLRARRRNHRTGIRRR
jgi:hypothetical protein